MSARYEKRITCTDEIQNAWLFELLDGEIVIVREMFDGLPAERIAALQEKFITNCEMLIETRV